jgi:hypothetical protein
LGESELSRPIFKLQVRPEPGIDGIHSLRAWLKIGLRVFGLRCVAIEEVKQVKQENTMADMRKYTSGFITSDDVREAPIEARIVSVYISDKHQVPVLELDNGDQFIAWPNNGRKLARAYGFDDAVWIGHLIRLEFDTYTNKDGETKETVKLTPISSRDSNAGNGTPQRVDPAKLPPPLCKDDLDDEITI